MPSTARPTATTGSFDEAQTCEKAAERQAGISPAQGGKTEKTPETKHCHASGTLYFRSDPTPAKRLTQTTPIMPADSTHRNATTWASMAGPCTAPMRHRLKNQKRTAYLVP
ncbi:Hypothetical predicted protein [Pelobates cultripes]|uniref:Uncharacterized protein n=1 Tax=Pelobates cultripes TaxID=61616 RepID=A0AAD1WLE1_PELCU|nr:Hypothetical predicted protein [Pelobates cultripes]